MILDRLVVQNFRNIESADLKVNPQANIIYGANGSGKTSVLEAISLLAHGKSFRSHLSTPLVKHGQSSTVLFSTLIDPVTGTAIPVGIEKHLRKGTNIRINKSNAKSTSELARLLPFLVVDGAAFTVIDGASKYRRKILDWLVFHVEPRFHRAWLGYQTALKQRNALLRRGILSGHEFDIWGQQCVEYGDLVTHLRMQWFSRLQAELEGLWADLGLSINLSFHKGWKEPLSLNDAFIEYHEGDCQRQTTRNGPHRADLLLNCDEGKVAEVFSRGQKKTAILALYLAVVSQFIKANNSKPVIALDDLPAELDKNHIQSVLAVLLERAHQVFITTINKEQVLELLPADIQLSVFHVEHGRITQESI